MRPRIRTIKPEMWEDEKVVALSRDARLLLLGLVTMADDEGRFRLRRSTMLGHVFPGDDDAVRRIDGWIREIQEQGVVVFYVEGGTPYGAFRHWRRHQKINKPTDSELPPPPSPGVVRENSLPKKGEGTESNGNGHSPTRAQAQRSDPIPEELLPHLDKSFEVLEALAKRHGAKAVNRLSLASVIAGRPHKPLVRSAYDCASYWDGQARRLQDVVRAYRNWLDKAEDLAGIEQLDPGARVIPMQRPAALQRADAWAQFYDEEAS